MEKDKMCGLQSLSGLAQDELHAEGEGGEMLMRAQGSQGRERRVRMVSRVKRIGNWRRTL